MATGDGIKTFSLACGGRANVRYLLVAAAVRLPQELFLGRMVVKVEKPTTRGKQGAAAFLGAGAARGTRRRSTRGRKK